MNRLSWLAASSGNLPVSTLTGLGFQTIWIFAWVLEIKLKSSSSVEITYPLSCLPSPSFYSTWSQSLLLGTSWCPCVPLGHPFCRNEAYCPLLLSIKKWSVASPRAPTSQCELSHHAWSHMKCHIKGVASISNSQSLVEIPTTNDLMSFTVLVTF